MRGNLGTALTALRMQSARRGFSPRPGWHSWEPNPAAHPWLTAAHLSQMQAFSRRAWDKAERAAEGRDPRDFRFAFVGNLANNLYQRAVPLRRRGLSVEMVLHPYDRFVMSQPGWDEWDGELVVDETDVEKLAQRGVRMPPVDHVTTLDALEQQLAVVDGHPAVPGELHALLERESFLRATDAVRFPIYLAHLPTLRHLQASDALMTTQAPYLAYLSGRPYLAAPGGGDLWLECSRGDEHGIINRLGFKRAHAILATNPSTFAHARRYGFANVIYLPFMLDDEVFSPGESRARAEWTARTGGSFFVLQTARVDERYKGSSVALEGFAHFARNNPEARLVLVSWGADLREKLESLIDPELRNRVLVLPLAGKRRVIEYLRAADVLVDQFALGAYGATALEAMGCGLPVIMRIERDQYDALVPAGAPPVLDARSPVEVADQLARVHADPERLRAAAAAARNWFVRAHGSSTWADVYCHLLVATALRSGFSYRRSPLAEPPTKAEDDYHAASLASAPPFLV